MEIPDLVLELVEKGINPTIIMHKGVICFDLHSNTKSFMYLHWDVDVRTFFVFGRYGEEDIIEDIGDLIEVFKERFYPKGFGSHQWRILSGIECCGGGCHTLA